MSSRICVKNLPKYVTSDRLKEFFSRKGEVTDANVMHTKDGKSRQFGFVGFRTAHEANETINYFDNSFFDTCKITCEIARGVGDPNTPRPWSRHSSLKKQKNSPEEEKRETGRKSSRVAVIGHESSKKRRIKDDVTNDEPQLEEFLQVMQSRTKSKLWANDTPLTAPSLEGTLSSEPNIVFNDDDVVSDMDYYRIRINKDWSDLESSDNQVDSVHRDVGDNNDGSNKTSADTSSREIKNEELLESGRLFVLNLPYTTIEEELVDHFSKYGTISEVHIVVDKDTKCSKGFAFVSFALHESAARALVETNGSIFQGRLLRVRPAEQRNVFDKQEVNNSGNNHSKTFKQTRIAEKKASEASGDSRAWNSLFMRQDTVVEYIARKNGVTKAQVLDRDSDNLAATIALAETQVIAETKEAFSSAGVNIAAGKTDGVKKSQHVILAKNLPYGSSESELLTMFGKFGRLEVILPPTKTLALLIFLEPAEARAAFNALRYKQYKDGPLYLEWAPANVLSKIPPVSKNPVAGGVDVSRVYREAQGAETTEADVDHDRNESRSIYVKNLNFKTSDETLKKHFTEHMTGKGQIRSVTVKKHQKNGKYVSKGYGFIEFDSVDTSLNVCKDLQGTVLDGHALRLQLCYVEDEQIHKKIENDRSSTKLLVRNVEFAATEKDLRQLFSTFGQIKSLRLPRAAGNHNHKGFAFVEYVTKQEALNALQALANTHFYGRHLVLERAKEGVSIDELRAKTAAQFTGSAKLSKKRKHTAVLDEGNVEFERFI